MMMDALPHGRASKVPFFIKKYINVCTVQCAQRAYSNAWVKMKGCPTKGAKFGTTEIFDKSIYFIIIKHPLDSRTANSAGAPARSPGAAPVSTEDRSGVGGASVGQDEQSRTAIQPETGEQPSLSLD